MRKQPEMVQLEEMHLVGIPVTALFREQGPNPRIETAKRQGLRSDPRKLSIEEYRFASPFWPDEVDVYVPIAEQASIKEG